LAIEGLGRTSSLVIAGAGEQQYSDTIRARVRQLGLSENVRMVGHVDGEDKERLFDNADVLVVPSHTENFGMVVAEALAHGIPVIASRGTPWKRLEEMGCGLWVDNSPASLASAIMRISSMPLRQMGLRGKDWMQKEFAWDYVAEEMIRVYRNILPVPTTP
jgi:glycosyltransferase involved in cell wall biosynthesis